MIVNRLGQRYHDVYDDWGQVTTVTDPLGSITRYDDDANHNETLMMTAADTPMAATTERGFDASGNLLWRTHPLGAHESYTYHANGMPETLYDPAGRPTQLTVDGQGRLTSISGSAGLTEFGYRVENE